MECRHNIFIIVSVYLINLFCGVFSFNIDTNFPIVYNNPGENNSTFGYSVILYEGNAETPPWIQIGAPKFKNDRKVETGHVYRCGIKQSCSLLNMPISLSVETVGAALGHTMDISPDGSIFATCGHRYIQNSTESKDYYSRGFCHWGNTNENSTEQKIPLSETKSTYDRPTGNGKTTAIYAYGNGQAGFSLQFANTHNNSSYSYMVVGVPGAMNWAGTFLLWQDQGGVGASRRRKRSTYSKYNIFENKATNDLSLAGYSVTSGYFTEKDRLDYAFGAPRAGMIGKVNLVKYSRTTENSFEIYGPSFDGMQYGEYYGGSLAAADLDGDGYSELIVGAPTYKTIKYNEGRIYIYKGGKTLSSEHKNLLHKDGKEIGAQFGDSIASLGDIDFDGYDDIAVAATYSDGGAGSVYIYRGSSVDLLANNPQVIKGIDIDLNVLGFGHSISRPRDIDGNGYNDLAIGAYKSEQAFIFRARPVITLKLPVIEPVVINYGIQSFNLNFTVEYSTKRTLQDPKLTLIPTLVIDPSYGRATVEAPEKIELLGPGIPVTQTYTVKIVKEDSANIDKIMDYTLSYKLEERVINPEAIVIGKEGTTGNDGFCSFCPVFDPKTKQDVAGWVSFNLGCGSDNKCYPELHVNSLFKEIESDGSNIFVIGSKSYIKLVTEVSNTGDKAYHAKLSVILPSKPKVTLRKLPASCKSDETEVTCPIANPLEGDKKTVELELDMTHINEGSNENLSFNVSVSTIGENKGEKFKKVQLLTRKSADISITGRSKEEYYTFDNTSSTVEFTQVLQIQKEGPSSLDNVLIDVEVPVSFGTDHFVEMYQPTLKEHPIMCESAIAFIEKKSLNNLDDSTSRSKRRRRNAVEDVTQKFKHFTGFNVNCSDDGLVQKGLKCEKLKCSTGSINRDVIEILFKFRLHIGEISRDILGESDVIIYSTNFDAKINDKSIQPKENDIHMSLSSVLVGPNVEKMVPIWIIIVAVLCGVLVLAIIAAVLYKFGFFKRANKEKLKEMAGLGATDATNLSATEEE